MRRSVALLLGMVLAVLVAGRSALALGEETFGNQPLNELNYKDWPGIPAVVNHPSRVYHTWVNGNEHFYYHGDSAALNDTLDRFAQAKSPLREVVLRPGPGTARTFDQSRTIGFRWGLHLVGGIARHLTTREKGDQVWAKHPVLTIHVDREIDLGKLRIPAGLTVTPFAQVKARTREGLKSGDKTVRGWSNGVLAELDPFDDASRDAIAAMLNDPDNWVRLNAAGSLALFGKKAQASLPQLREALATEDMQLRKRVQETIGAIEKAEEQTAAEKEYRAATECIQQFLDARKGYR